MKFPSIKAKNLLREQVAIPRELNGELILLLIPFQQWQQRSVDSWLPYVQELELTYPNFTYYELPTIRRMNGLSRLLINEGMRAGIPDPRSREKTITLYIDKRKFRSLLGIDSEEKITVLLINRDGNILWRTKGDCTEALMADLESVIRQLMINNPDCVDLIS